MEQIFHMCPNLDLLSCVENPAKITLASDIKPDTLSCLTVLDLSGSYDHNVNLVELVVEKGMLLQLLQAPELRMLKLSMNVMDYWELKEILRRLRRREILQKLELAMIKPSHRKYFYSSDDDADHPLALTETRQTNRLLNNMVLNCPNLYGVFDSFPRGYLDGNWDGRI